MAFPQRLLGEGEEVVLHMRTHAKALVIPSWCCLSRRRPSALPWVSCQMREAGRRPADGCSWPWAGVVGRWSLWPFLVWLSTTYTVTTERLITRQGVINRRGRDIPLGRINDVAYSQDLIDRMLRCGSLNVSARVSRARSCCATCLGCMRYSSR